MVSFQGHLPFAVVGSMDEVKVGNKMVKARHYPWGVVQGKWDKRWLEIFILPNSLKVAFNAFFEVILILDYDWLLEKLAMFCSSHIYRAQTEPPHFLYYTTHITSPGVPRHSEGGTDWSDTWNKIWV